MHGKSLHNRAAILEVALQRCGRALAFRSCETKPREHEREMPAELDLFGFGEEAEEFCFVAIEEAGFLGGNFFGGIGGAHSYNGIFVPEALDELAKAAWLFENELRHFVRASDGAPVRSFEHRRNFWPRHVAKRGLRRSRRGRGRLGCFRGGSRGR